MLPIQALKIFIGLGGEILEGDIREIIGSTWNLFKNRNFHLLDED
jgi:hypothetical protein